jgi:hypothetical protein
MKKTLVLGDINLIYLLETINDGLSKDLHSTH